MIYDIKEINQELSQCIDRPTNSKECLKEYSTDIIKELRILKIQLDFLFAKE